MAHSVARDGEAPDALTLYHLLPILDLNHVILERYLEQSAVSLISDGDLTSLQNETVRVIFDSRAVANQVNH